MLGAAVALREHTDIQILCVGGTTDDVANMIAKKVAQQLTNIDFLGHKEKVLIPKYLAAADVLLLPNTAESIESVAHTSPLKLFEYLAAKRPIICSDLPSLRSVVSDDEVLFVSAGDADVLAQGILQVLINEPERALERAQHAYVRSREFTWNAHALALMAVFKAGF